VFNSEASKVQEVKRTRTLI